MFGYVNVLQDELKIKEFKLFKAYYCGLCKRQGELFGNLSRLALSYDFTALAVILDSLEEAPAEVDAGKCLLHPLQKRPIVRRCDSLSYCACMSVALTYFKIKDDLVDGGFSKKAAALPVFKSALKKVKKDYPEKIGVLEKSLTDLAALEKRNCKNIDSPAKLFGELMAELFDYGEKNSRVLTALGYNLGRWIYIIDAIDDFEKDVKRGSYNPFSSSDDIVASLPSLWYNMSEIAAAYELLDIKHNKPLTDNIIYLGIKGATEKVIKKYENKQMNGEDYGRI